MRFTKIEITCKFKYIKKIPNIFNMFNYSLNDVLNFILQIF